MFSGSHVWDIFRGSCGLILEAAVNKILDNLKNVSSVTAKWKSFPDPKAFSKVSFHGCKPDIINYEKDHTNTLAITSFGDWKKRGQGNFSNEEKGHILDMACIFMNQVDGIDPF